MATPIIPWPVQGRLFFRNADGLSAFALVESAWFAAEAHRLGIEGAA